VGFSRWREKSILEKYSGDIPTITWWNKKKLIQIDGVNAMAIKRKLLSENMVSCENISNESATPRLNEASNAMSSAMETCGCTCNCLDKVSTVDMEGLKHDMTILESRLNSVGSCNAQNSELNSLKSKQQAMEAIIRKHEQIICNLNDDNTFFKAKLMSFVEQTPIVTYSNHAKNVNNADRSVGTINTEHGFGDSQIELNTNTNELRLKNGGTIAEDIMPPQLVCAANDSVIIDNPNHEDNSDNAISDGIVHPSDKNKITYAQIVALSPKPKDKVKVKVNNHGPQKENTENADLPNDTPVGFIGVERKNKKVEKLFISGIADNVKPNQVLTYLKQRGVVPTFISMFASKRKGTLSAKIHIPSSSKHLVKKTDFWPKFVGCSLVDLGNQTLIKLI
jgi:hypothetical protein